MKYVYVGLACIVAGIFLRPLVGRLFLKIGTFFGKES